jgi:hypothetical protein
MSTSSPVRIRQPRRPSRLLQAGSNRFPRAESVVTVVRSILLLVAAVSVIGTSNYLAYLIGRKQTSYEEFRRQVDRVVQLMDQKQVEEESAPTLKQQQDRLEQNASGLTDLTTSTINGKTTVVAPERARVESMKPAAPIDAATVALRLQSPETSPNATTKQHDVPGVAHQRGSRRPKASRRAPTEAAEQAPGQFTTSIPATARDASVAGQ